MKWVFVAHKLDTYYLWFANNQHQVKNGRVYVVYFGKTPLLCNLQPMQNGRKAAINCDRF